MSGACSMQVYHLLGYSSFSPNNRLNSQQHAASVSLTYNKKQKYCPLEAQGFWDGRWIRDKEGYGGYDLLYILLFLGHQ